jgi:pimeloyl-ACP methyl ester carboxylesterase
MIWGVAIPGLSMHSRLLPEVDGVVRLTNPDFSDSPPMEGPYTLEDVARFQLANIQKLIPKMTSDLTIMGMSMGGMITAILASKYRAELPKQVKFRFLVTSANLPNNPCITKTMLHGWQNAIPRDVESFGHVLHPFFSKIFRAEHPDIVAKYVEDRAFGRSGQSAQAFFKQVQAVLQFNGQDYFSALNPDECTFWHGEDDEIMHTVHHAELRELAPHCRHVVMSKIGHMVNFENPSLFERAIE